MRSDSAGFLTSRSCCTANRSALESTSRILSRDSCDSVWFVVLVVSLEKYVCRVSAVRSRRPPFSERWNEVIVQNPSRSIKTGRRHQRLHHRFVDRFDVMLEVGCRSKTFQTLVQRSQVFGRDL